MILRNLLFLILLISSTVFSAAGGTPINRANGTLMGDAIYDDTDQSQIQVKSGSGVKLGQTVNPSGRAVLYLDSSNFITGGVSIDYINNLTSDAQAQLGRRQVSLFDYFADANNTTTTETTLYTNNITNQLATNGDKIIYDYGGIYTGAATSTQELRMKFAGVTIFDSGALAIGAVTSNWRLSGQCIREVGGAGTGVVRCIAEYASSNVALSASSTYTRVTGLTLTNSQTINITGQAAGVSAASNQITAKLGNISYLAH